MTTTLAELERPKEYPPGIYPGVSMADYSALSRMNCSTLRWARASMRHLHAAMMRRIEREDTEALQFGRAMHIRILEPDRYAAAVLIRRSCAAPLKSGERKGEPCGCTGVGMSGGDWYCGKHGGDEGTLDAKLEYITEAEAWSIEQVSEAIKEHKIDNLRRAKGLFEVAVIGQLCGVDFKARLDKLITSPSAIVDVKKVAAPASPDRSLCGPEDFEKRIASYGYGMAAAAYVDLVEGVTGVRPRWYWLVVEDGPPFTVSCFKASDALLEAGRNEYSGMLYRYKECVASGKWPGPAVEPVTIDGPAWWLKQNGGML